ncbi:MAG: heme exporter protein CcmB [Anaplasma sp.]
MLLADHMEYPSVFYVSILIRELKEMFCNGGSALQVVLLFIVVVGTALFVLPSECANKVMPCLFWVCGVTVMQVSMRALFNDDYHSGVLEQLLIQNSLPEGIMFLKILAHWICVSVPISFAAALMDFVILGEGIYQSISLGVALSAGFLVVNFISAVGHALVLGGTGGLITAQILVFPMIVPVVVCLNLFLRDYMCFACKTVVLLGIGMLCLIPVSVVFVLSAVRLAVEQD